MSDNTTDKNLFDWPEDFLDGLAKENLADVNKTLGGMTGAIVKGVNATLNTLTEQVLESEESFNATTLRNWTSSVMEYVDLSVRRINQIYQTLEERPEPECPLAPALGWFNLFNSSAWWPVVAMVWGVVVLLAVGFAVCCCKCSIITPKMQVSMRKKPSNLPITQNEYEMVTYRRPPSSHGASVTAVAARPNQDLPPPPAPEGTQEDLSEQASGVYEAAAAIAE